MDRPAGADKHRAGQGCVHGRGEEGERAGAEEWRWCDAMRNRLAGAGGADGEDSRAAQHEGRAGARDAATEQVHAAERVQVRGARGDRERGEAGGG